MGVGGLGRRVIRSAISASSAARPSAAAQRTDCSRIAGRTAGVRNGGRRSQCSSADGGRAGDEPMMIAPAGVKVHLALGYTDMRKGLDGLATLVQEHLKKDPFSGHLFAFRGRNASRLKILFW